MAHDPWEKVAEWARRMQSQIFHLLLLLRARRKLQAKEFGEAGQVCHITIGIIMGVVSKPKMLNWIRATHPGCPVPTLHDCFAAFLQECQD